MVDKFIEAIKLFEQISPGGDYLDKNRKMKITSNYHIPEPPPYVLPHPQTYIDNGKKEEYIEILNKNCLKMYKNYDNGIMRFHFNLRTKIETDEGEMFYVERHKFTGQGKRIDIENIHEYDEKAERIHNILSELCEEDVIGPIWKSLSSPSFDEKYVKNDHVVIKEYQNEYNEWTKKCEELYHLNNDEQEFGDFETLCSFLIDHQLNNFTNFCEFGDYKTVDFYQIFDESYKYDYDNNIDNIYPMPDIKWFETITGNAKITDRNYDIYVKYNTDFYEKLVDAGIINYKYFDSDIFNILENKFYSHYKWKQN